MSRQNVFVRNLPRGTTREELADFLWQEMSLQVDPERMFLHKFSGENPAASIRIGAGDIAALLNLYLSDKPFGGNILTFEVAARGPSSLKFTVDQVTITLPSGELNRNGIKILK